MTLVEEILETLPEGKIEDIMMGLHWTAVVVQCNGIRRCGISATLREEDAHHHGPDVPNAGSLLDVPAREMAGWILSEKAPLASLGGAALNALLPRNPETWIDVNASEMITRLGIGKKVALVGHFGFVEQLRQDVGELFVLEKNPQPGDLPAEAASEVIPQCDVLAITGMTVANRTLEELLALRAPQAAVIILGPSTPLSPVFFRHGVRMVSGAVVEDIDAALRTLKQGANFHQIRKAGARLVTMVHEAGQV